MIMKPEYGDRPMPEDFTMPATNDIRTAYALRYGGEVNSNGYIKALTRFDRWLRRQIDLAVQTERDWNAKGQRMTPLCSWCGHPRHDLACPSKIETGTAKKPDPQPCPCAKRWCTP